MAGLRDGGRRPETVERREEPSVDDDGKNDRPVVSFFVSEREKEILEEREKEDGCVACERMRRKTLDIVLVR